MMTTTKERPILFTPRMAQLCHTGAKTQTRRVVKPQPDWPHNPLQFSHDLSCWGLEGFDIRRCPYGQPGDRLWVRESCRIYDWTEEGEPFVQYRDEAIRLCRVPEEETDKWADYWAALSRPDNFNIEERASERKWRPNIHMPRWACRSVLEVVKVRVERVQDISHQDAREEGFDNQPQFLQTFYDINKRAPRSENPWVWVIEFKKFPAPTARKGLDEIAPKACEAEGKG